MDSQNFRGRWSGKTHLRINVRRPDGPKIVSVLAEISPYPFFGCFAQLGRDVLDALEIWDGKKRTGWGDDSGEVNESGEEYRWTESTAEIRFRNTAIVGPVVLQLASNHSYIFSHFLEKIPLTEQLNDGRNDVVSTTDTTLLLSPVKRVFLSHSHKDKKFCRTLANSLRRAGIYVWLDEAEIKVGDSLIEKLRAGIDGVDFVVAILSEASVGSNWVQKELDVAMTQEIKERRVKVLPVLREEIEPPGFLIGKLFADFRTPTSSRKALPKLIEGISSL